MTVIMVLILWLIAQMDEHDHHHIRQEIRQRVDSISYHRSRMTYNTCHELKDEQDDIDEATGKGNPIYPPLTSNTSHLLFNTLAAKLL